MTQCARATTRLIVYGSLAPGEANHHVVADLRGRWLTGWVEGELHEVGWGAAHGYPGMRHIAGGTRIDVQVLESDDLARHWDRLDEFEGAEYRRVLIPVCLDSGEVVEGWIYEIALTDD